MIRPVHVLLGVLSLPAGFCLSAAAAPPDQTISIEVPSDQELKAILARVLADKRFRTEPEPTLAKTKARSQDPAYTGSDRTARQSAGPATAESPNVRRWGRGVFRDGASQVEPTGEASFSLSLGGWPVGLAWVVAGILLAAVGAGALVLLYQVWLNRGPKLSTRAASEPAPSALSQPASALDKDLPGWFAESDLLAADGRFREAFRAIYLALLAHLHRLRLIDYRRHKTNWENVRTYRGPVGSGESLHHLTRSFDYVWYGGCRHERLEFVSARATVENLVRGLNE